MDLFNDCDWIKLEKKEPFLEKFKCEDDDLNDFLKDNAIDYYNQLLAVTYIFLEKKSKHPVCFFSVLNDRIQREDFPTNSQFKKNILKNFPYPKRTLKSFPAVKIGRFAVDSNYSGRGVGTQLINIIKAFFYYKNKTGCAYITVEAYSKALSFYEKSGFNYCTKEDKGENTRLMYYNLAYLN